MCATGRSPLPKRWNVRVLPRDGGAATAALTVRPTETIQRAAQLMTEHATAHLVVVDEERRPLGVISTLDIAAALGER